MVKILPQLFYESPDVKKILVDGLSCVVYKRLESPVWHKEGYVSTHAITLVLKGLLRVENDEGLFAEVPENKMVFLPKGLYTISDIIPKSGSFEAMVFFFETEVISNFLESLSLKCCKQKSISHLLLDYTDNIRIFTEALLHLYSENEKPNRQLTGMKLFELLHLIHTAQGNNCFVTALTTLNNKERRSLREFMYANFSKPLSIEDYAYLTGRSLSTFRRDFKAQFGGISPKQWLIDRRLEKARELLSKNHTTVSDVVSEIGYENVPHFIKTFKGKYGLPPKQFLIQRRKETMV
jgi:AraC-like DNA-binding protein